MNVSCLEEGRNLKSRVAIEHSLTKPGAEAIIESIAAGLYSEKKHISCVYLYDAVGSKLFEKITGLDEYYPARIEKSLLKDAAIYICDFLRDADIVELGSGDCSKISILLDAVPSHCLHSLRYIPVDVSHSAIDESARILSGRFPGITINGVIADFMNQLDIVPDGSKRFFCFLGSTIGNLSRTDALDFITYLGEIMSSGDMLLLGADMVKDIDMLEKAYNDSQGITAEFNLNILNVVNSLAKTDFVPGKFEHLAFYNDKLSRIEMHLKAGEDMEIASPLIDENIFIRKGETIHTENSHKFTLEHLEGLSLAANLEIEHIFTDENKWFSLVLMSKN